MTSCPDSTEPIPTVVGPEPTLPAKVRVEGVSKWFRVDGAILQVLDGVSLEARTGQFVSVIGPSGSGKTTLFNIVCGLMRPDAGQVAVDGGPGRPLRGAVAYMPQKDLLMPWRTVLENVLLGAEVAGQFLAEARREALELVPEFGLEGFERRYPHELSGGMRQRAALLRTYLLHRDVLLLDEPFGALDALTRRKLQLWLMSVWEEHRKTILFITHDVDEAVFLSDRVFALTPRPARVACSVAVDLPRPRSAQTLFLPHFDELRANLLHALDVL